MHGYRSVRLLAEGGMGRVELVVREDGAFRRAYAMKRLRGALAHDPGARAMFTEEARIAGLLHHPNVVSVIDVGEDESGPYLVMDYVQGVSLSEVIQALCRRERLMPVQLALRVFIEIARGLHAAHELVGHDGERLDLVHRDVSPQNILVGFDGVARLTDFGIAKARVGGEKTSAGLLKGKIGYFAPEQLRFRPVTAQTDLFALGVVLFEALSGRRLYASQSAEQTARRILEEPPPDLFEVRQDAHPALSELLFRLLAKPPSRRPASAAEVATELESILVEVLGAEPPLDPAELLRELHADRAEAERALIESVTTGAGPRRARSRWRWAVAAAAAGALAIGGAAAGLLWSRASDAEADAVVVLPATAPSHPISPDAPANPEAETDPGDDANGTAPGPREGGGEGGDATADAPTVGAEARTPDRRARRRRRRAPIAHPGPPSDEPGRPPRDDLMGWTAP